MTEAIRRYRANWQDELESAALYQALASVESNPALATVYVRLAAVEQEHSSGRSS
jgi:vacuolar iron transporter family protein